jgi:hypothetical protein
MAKKTKHPVLRVRRPNKTDRNRLGTMSIPDKKKKNNKNRCKEDKDYCDYD